MDDNVCHADARIRGDRHIKVSNITQELDILLGNVHSTVHNHMDY
jgi:hypothetical protein